MPLNVCTHDVRHFFKHRPDHRPNLFAFGNFQLFRRFQRDFFAARNGQGHMAASGRLVTRVDHLPLLHHRNAGRATANIHHSGFIQIEQMRHRRWLVNHRRNL